MTTFEHAMVGATGAMASGLHKRHGWKIVASPGSLEPVPMGRLDHSYRQSNLLHGPSHLGPQPAGMFGCWSPCRDARLSIRHRDANLSVPGASHSSGRQFGFLAAARVSPLARVVDLDRRRCASRADSSSADWVVSGTATLDDWKLKPLWLFHDHETIHAMVPWGDPGMTLCFVLGMFAMLRWKGHLQLLACCTLFLVAAYIGVRGMTH